MPPEGRTIKHIEHEAAPAPPDDYAQDVAVSRGPLYDIVIDPTIEPVEPFVDVSPSAESIPPEDEDEPAFEGFTPERAHHPENTESATNIPPPPPESADAPSPETPAPAPDSTGSGANQPPDVPTAGDLSGETPDDDNHGDHTSNKTQPPDTTSRRRYDREGEAGLIRDWQNPDNPHADEAATELVKRYDDQLINIAKEVMSRHPDVTVPFEDVYQACRDAFASAAQNWEPETKALISHATRNVRWAALQVVSREAQSPISLTQAELELVEKLHDLEDRHLQEGKPMPTDEEVAEELDILQKPWNKEANVEHLRQLVTLRDNTSSLEQLPPSEYESAIHVFSPEAQHELSPDEMERERSREVQYARKLVESAEELMPLYLEEAQTREQRYHRGRALVYLYKLAEGKPYRQIAEEETGLTGKRVPLQTVAAAVKRYREWQARQMTSDPKSGA